MATQEELNNVRRGLQELPRMVETCEQVAKALIETKQPLSQAGTPLGVFWGTDYDRARRQIRRRCRLIQNLLRRVRRTALSPDAIRGQSEIRTIQRACERCLFVNRQGLQQGKAFRCLANGQSGQVGGGFRFRLDLKGNILESS